MVDNGGTPFGRLFCSPTAGGDRSDVRPATGTTPDDRIAKSVADRYLSQFWNDYVGSGRGGLGYLSRHPFRALRALGAIRRLRVVIANDQSDTPGGREVRRILDQKGPLRLPARWWGSAVLPVL